MRGNILYNSLEGGCDCWPLCFKLQSMFEMELYNMSTIMWYFKRITRGMGQSVDRIFGRRKDRNANIWTSVKICGNKSEVIRWYLHLPLHFFGMSRYDSGPICHYDDASTLYLNQQDTDKWYTDDDIIMYSRAIKLQKINFILTSIYWWPFRTIM